MAVRGRPPHIHEADIACGDVRRPARLDGQRAELAEQGGHSVCGPPCPRTASLRAPISAGNEPLPAPAAESSATTVAEPCAAPLVPSSIRPF